MNIEELYGSSEFIDKIEFIDQIIQTKMISLRRHQRLSCQQILASMKEWTFDKHLIRNQECYEFYLNKFQNATIYFYDILRCD